MEEKVRNILTQPLMVHFRPGPGNRKYRYVEGRDVISRLNTAFEHEWSSRVISTDKVDNQIIVLIELEANNIVHHGYGGSEVALYTAGPKQGTPVDISNSYKAAFTNALKKAAEQFGIGLVSEDEVSESPQQPSVDAVTSPTQKTIESSVTVSTSPIIDPATHDAVETIRKQIQDMLAGKTPMSEEIKKTVEALENATENTAVAATKPKEWKPLASTFKEQTNGYDPEKSRVSEVSTPFKASGNGDEMINDIQLHAIEGLARMKKLDARSLITKAIPGTSKIKYDDLTKNEARAVILTLNNTDTTK